MELNKAGWWDKAVDRLIIATIWLARKPLSLPEVLEGMHQYFQVQQDKEVISSKLGGLCRDGVLIRVVHDWLKISEPALAALEKDRTAAADRERLVTEAFVAIVRKDCPSLDPEAAWSDFNERFLLPLVQEIGAQTYHLISGINPTLHSGRVDHFLRQYPEDLRATLRGAIVSFLDPANPTVRSYVLCALSGYFFMEASNLSQATVEAITRTTRAKPTFTVFADTNFLLAILGLHASPLNEPGTVLLKLLSELSERVIVSVYALPRSIEEAREVLLATQKALSGLRLTSNLADAVVDLGLGDIAQGFAERCREQRNWSLTPEDYFGPYIRDMHEVLRARGIKVFEERTAPPVNEDELHADMRLALKLERRYGASAKRDKQIEHDVSLWHRVRTLRPNAVESPLAARYWIVTLDSHFLAFDRFKREIVREPIPLCIRPGTLIQMLQFWVPRSAEFERAMLSSMRLPVIVGDFDRDAEKVTIRILQVLSRFENVGDLPSETIAAILVNDALREKMRLPMERAKEVDLIKEALIAEHQAAKEALAATSEKAARLQGEVGQGARTIEGLQTQVATQRQVLDEELERRRGVEKKVQDWQEAEVTRQNREANRKTARRFLAFKVALPLLAILVSAFFAARTSAQISGWRFGWAFLGFLSTLLLPWGWLSDYHGAKQDAVKDTRAFALFHRTRAWLFWLLGILACGVGANAAWFFFGHGRGWF